MLLCFMCGVQELDSAAAELAASNPNMKAVEQYEAVREKERQQVGQATVLAR